MPVKKKRQSVLTRIGQKIKTPKGRLITTFVAFAVIGGGIFVYKSFAATNGWTYNLDNGYMSVSTDNSAKCRITKARDKDYYNLTIANFACSSDGFALASARGASGAANQSYQVCAWAKGTGKIAMVLNGNSTLGGANRTYDVTSTKYNYYCSGFFRMSGVNQGLTAVANIGKKGSFINVASLVVELQ